ncbi:MAG: hypothetical protein H6983_25905 [Ectothiorhodospiraceae bacterium]|nr:hypothetical protein [Ectothiorhodospiraceae bacterium]
MGGLRGWQFWTVNALALLAVVLVLVNTVLARNNRDIQRDVITRQQTIDDGVRLAQVNAQLIRALANLSAQTGDEALRDLLASQGVTFRVQQPPAAPLR